MVQCSDIPSRKKFQRNVIHGHGDPKKRNSTIMNSVSNIFKEMIH